MRRVNISDFNRLPRPDKEAVQRWVAEHGFRLERRAEGGDWVQELELFVPTDRVWTPDWPWGGLEDCWLIVYHYTNPDGSRFRVEVDAPDERMMRRAVRALRSRPPDCLMAIAEEASTARFPGHARMKRDLLDMWRQLSTELSPDGG